jgi:hypothetical protein
VNKDNRKRKLTISSLVLIISIIIFFASTIVNNIINITIIRSFILSATLFGIVFICWLCVTLIIWIVKKYNFINIDENDKKTLLLSVNINDLKPCKECNNICCLDTLLKTPGIKKMQMSETDRVNNNLFYPDIIGDIEAIGKWKDIWIFSGDLYTEIEQNKGIESLETVVVENIQKRDITYTEFYCDIETERPKIEIRKKKMLNSLATTHDKKKLIFVPFQHDGKYIGKNSMPLLCGSILFSSDRKDDGTPHFIEGYLSMRLNREDSPIYYKMPRCMLREYCDFFKREYYKRIKKRKRSVNSQNIKKYRQSNRGKIS